MNPAQLKQLAFAAAFILLLIYNVALVQQKRAYEKKIVEQEQRIEALEQELGAAAER